MDHANSMSLARIIAAAWQQRRNAGSVWGFAVVVALCFAAPVGLSVWSLFVEPALVERLQDSIRVSAWVGVAALLIAGWVMLVGNVLMQNHPTLARLVPGHVVRLRGALLAAWTMLVLLAAGVPGFAFDAPLEWACGMAAALVVLAAALRWPLLWLAGFVVPFAMAWFLGWRGHQAVVADLRAQWQSVSWLVMAIVATAGATVLTLLIRGGGTVHGASYDARRRLMRAVGVGCDGGMQAARGRFGPKLSRPYAAWMQHLLARGDSPLMSRLLVGLGPSTHWTTRIFEAFWSLVVSAAVCLGVSGLVGQGMLTFVLPWLCFSMLTTVSTPALQAAPKLYQTRQEQALLALLPGVPRGARLNRWLAWQMSLAFVAAALCGMALAWALGHYADSLKPGVVGSVTGGMVPALAASLLPQVAWQWRRWASLRGASDAREVLPSLTPFLLGGAILALHWTLGVGYLACGVASTVASLLWCAWRWHRMGHEPTAFPAGRLA